jgi:glycosyltransferase involved in cell wall biosynthesis
MTGTPLVSVVVATYNMARYLPAAIESVLAQTYRHFELHVIDDGSTDATASVRETFAGVPRVKWHRQRNAGQARAKNAGIRASRGALVAFLDADDLWRPRKLEEQAAVFAQHPRVGVVYSPVEYIDAAGRLTGARSEPPRPHTRVVRDLFRDNFIPFPTAMVRRSCLERAGLFDESLRMSIDWDLWLRLAVDYEFAGLPEPLALYRVWDGQMSRDVHTRFECTRLVMQRFLRAHADVLERDEIAAAWAHTYTRQGRRLAAAGHSREAARWLVAALGYRPSSLFAWKSLLRVAVGGHSS